jgi:CRISPR-associated Csx2 family protein
MARKVFISFLGMGGRMTPGYIEVVYKTWRSDNMEETKEKRTFVQTAILELYPHSEIDKIVILTTPESEIKHKAPLKEELKSIGVSDDKYVEISNISSDLTKTDAAWEWFNQLQSVVEKDDIVILDVTHGFRIVPIVFSAAIGYLKRAKNVFVESVLYGVFDAEGEKKPIVDMRDFYSINDWTEAVGRLIDDADAGFLHRVAEKEESVGFTGLNDTDLLNSVEILTQALKNVEIQKVESYTQKALNLVNNKINEVKPLEKQILEMIVEKFQSLISGPPANGIYSKDYLSLQIRFITLLAQHGLYMQCFTAMREWLGSLGCAINGEFKFISKSQDEKARRYAEIFVSMLQFPKEKWNFDDDVNKKAQKDKLLPAYSAIEKLSNFEEIKILLEKIVKKIRNGFDHAWTGSHLNSSYISEIKIISNEGVALFNQIVENWDSIIENYNSTNKNNSQLSISNFQLFINLSNHSSAFWQAPQLEAATVYGEIIDLPFPFVNPEGDEKYIQSLGNEYVEKIEQLAQGKNVTVHLMGELTLTYCLVKILITKGIKCIASTTERIVKEKDGIKTSEFRFKQFREYK